MDNISNLDLTGSYSYKDYLTWKFKERIELIKGKVFKMSPAPRRIHQKVSLRFTLSIGDQLKNSECELYEAPFDVRLMNNSLDNEKIVNVVQPDLCVICDLEKLDEFGCIGAPDLIVEIISPSTSKKDTQDKFELYQQHGVKEYWIVHTYDKLVDVFHLENSRFALSKIYAEDGSISSKAVVGLEVDLREIFENLG